MRTWKTKQKNQDNSALKEHELWKKKVILKQGLAKYGPQIHPLPVLYSLQAKNSFYMAE